MSDDQKPYRVGRGRPPLHGRFQPGRSGNPKGRPKGLKSPHIILNQLLARKITIGSGPSRRFVTTVEAMLLQQIHSALKGDRKAVELLLRMEAAVAAGPEHAPLFSAAEDLEILRSFADKVVTKGDSDE